MLSISLEERLAFFIAVESSIRLLTCRIGEEGKELLPVPDCVKEEALVLFIGAEMPLELVMFAPVVKLLEL